MNPYTNCRGTQLHANVLELARTIILDPFPKLKLNIIFIQLNQSLNKNIVNTILYNQQQNIKEKHPLPHPLKIVYKRGDGEQCRWQKRQKLRKKV